MNIEHNFKKKNGKIPRIVNVQQFLIWKFIKTAELGCNWPAEMKLATKILEKYPQLEFWRCLNIGFQLNSLAYFLTPAGKNLLEIEWRKSKLNLNEEKDKIDYKLELSKIGADFEIKKEIKTIKDFINS